MKGIIFNVLEDVVVANFARRFGTASSRRSPRKLCAIAHGFIEGVADHYPEEVAVEHLKCMRHGDARCLMRMTVH